MPTNIGPLHFCLNGLPARFYHRTVIAFIWCLVAGSLAAADAELKSVFPTSCQVGTDIDISLVGGGVDQGGAIHFSQVGLSAEHLEKGRFRVTASPDAAVGDGDLWVATPTGVVGPRRFSVTKNPVILEQESNDNRDECHQVQISTVIEARLEKKADLDWFAFEAQKQQQITISCRSQSLDGSVQPVFTVFGPDGSEILHSTAYQNEPQLDFQLPSSGVYRLLLHDRSYRKDDFSFYRLELKAGVQRTMAKHNGLVGPLDGFAEIPNVDEEAQSRQTPQRIEIPCRVSGRFFHRNDVDWFCFQAKKSQVFHVEGFGDRLGQLMDLEASIYNSEDKIVSVVKDVATPKGTPATLPLASLDPAVEWKAPADGEYKIALRDLYGGSVFGSDRVYELVVENKRPAFLAIAMPSTSEPGRGAVVKKGESTELSLVIVRTGGFTGEITVNGDIDVAGVMVKQCVLSDKELTKAIVVSAAEDAPVGFHLLRLVAAAQIGSDMLSLPVLNAAHVRPAMTRRIDQLIIHISK